MEVEPRVPARRLRWLPRGDHTVFALPQGPRASRPTRVAPRVIQAQSQVPFPSPVTPKSLTCVDKKQDQLRKQDPWTPGQPPRVHPSRWPEVARRDGRTDTGKGAASEGRTPDTERLEDVQRERATLPRGRSRGDRAIALEAFEGSPGRPAQGCAGTEVSLSPPAALRRQTRQPSLASWATRAHISSPRVAPTWGGGRRVAPTPPYPPVLASVESDSLS